MDSDAQRATREAWAAHRAEVRRGLRPEDYQPWNETPPDGWPLQEALFAFAPDVYRSQVSMHLAEVHAFIPDPQATANLEASCWNWLRLRLSRGELTATGYVNRETEEKPLRPSVFDRAELNFATKEFTSGDRTYSAVRVFEVDASDQTPPSGNDGSTAKERSGPEPRHGDPFIQEMLRFALHPDGFQSRKQLTDHMKEWCAKTLGDQAPAGRSIERWIGRYCPPELPDR